MSKTTALIFLKSPQTDTWPSNTPFNFGGSPETLLFFQSPNQVLADVRNVWLIDLVLQDPNNNKHYKKWGFWQQDLHISNEISELLKMFSHHFYNVAAHRTITSFIMILRKFRRQFSWQMLFKEALWVNSSDCFLEHLFCTKFLSISATAANCLWNCLWGQTVVPQWFLAAVNACCAGSDHVQIGEISQAYVQSKS